MKLLSTKILTAEQRSLVPSTIKNFKEYNAIEISSTPFRTEGHFDHLIFTSKNAVKSYLKGEQATATGTSPKETSCFCVGEKTKRLLEDNGYKVLWMAENALDLAKIIASKYPTSSFLFPHGDRAREELPAFLKDHGVSMQSMEVYKTRLTPKPFKEEFESILFFSPSGVRSHAQMNDLSNSTAYCIGSTTAREAEKYCKRVFIADSPTIEAVLAKVNENLKANI